MRYTPPTTSDLAALKARLSRTGDQMADLFGIAGSHQWRKYTGGQSPRKLSAQMAFFAAARLSLTDGEMARVLDQMREIGADIEIDAPDSAN